MKKPYAVSTLLRKYRQTGLSTDVIDRVRLYLDACSNFYYIIEIEEVYKIIESRERKLLSRDQFDTLISIMARDAEMDGYIIPKSEVYADGNDTLLLVSKDYLCVDNDEEPDGDSDSDEWYPIVEDWDRFYPLDGQRYGKPRNVPANLLKYADYEYYEKTSAVKAMMEFLSVQMKKKNAPKFKYGDPVNEYMIDLIDIVKDPTIMPAQATNRIIEEYNDCFPAMDMALTQKFVQLYNDINNTTCMPANNGHSPHSLHAAMGIKPSMPKSMSFGPGIQAALRSGKLNPQEMRQGINAMRDLPDSLRNSMLSAIDKALEPGEERWVGGTLYKGEKIGPNCPCTCGSGKKYKKCCGRKA